jgi:acetolactate synthase-1/2/3 large subunit
MSRSINELDKFLKKVDLPIVTTWSGLDTVDYNNKNYVGCIGVYGSRAANFAVQNADLVLNFGSRLDTRITGGKPETFARLAKVVSIDIDKHELNKKRSTFFSLSYFVHKCLIYFIVCVFIINNFENFKLC